jgi:putative oxidoreductase
MTKFVGSARPATNLKNTFLSQALPPLARALMAALFLVAGFRKLADWQGAIAYFNKLGVPMPELTLALVLVVEIIGGIVLISGWRTARVSTALAIYTIATAFVAHRFWAADPAQFAGQLNNFLKNLAIAGGFIYMASDIR